jgi:hypothetical protein
VNHRNPVIWQWTAVSKNSTTIERTVQNFLNIWSIGFFSNRRVIGMFLPLPILFLHDRTEHLLFEQCHWFGHDLNQQLSSCFCESGSQPLSSSLWFSLAFRQSPSRFWSKILSLIHYLLILISHEPEYIEPLFGDVLTK